MHRSASDKHYFLSTKRKAILHSENVGEDFRAADRTIKLHRNGSEIFALQINSKPKTLNQKLKLGNKDLKTLEP